MNKQINKGVFKVLGASNHTSHDRAKEDYYATEPKALELLLEKESFCSNIWENACGGCHLANLLRSKGYNVRATDLIDRGGGTDYIYDFLLPRLEVFDGDIITNPPYTVALEFVEKSLDTVTQGHKVAMFLRLQFLEGKARRRFFDRYPPKTIYVSSSRLKCALDGDFENMTGSAISYAWFVWLKGYTGETVIKWIN